jgi:IPT/TIG domain-containing protein
MGPLPPKLISISPREGFTTGTEKVILHGDNFDETTMARFADVRTTVRLISQWELEAETPPHGEPGPIAVELFTPDGVSIRYEGVFTYVARPEMVLESLTPNFGPTTGGTKLLLDGEGFPAEARVRIAREPPKSAVVRSPQRIEILTAPSKSAGLVDLEVTSPFTRTVVMKAGFRYDARPAPSITSVAPNRGAVGGGTEVTLAGKNFIAETQVLVGGKAVKSKLVDPSTIELEMPGGEDGQMVDVAVKNPDGKEAVARRAFQYDARYS